MHQRVATQFASTQLEQLPCCTHDNAVFGADAARCSTAKGIYVQRCPPTWCLLGACVLLISRNSSFSLGTTTQAFGSR